MKIKTYNKILRIIIAILMIISICSNVSAAFNINNVNNNRSLNDADNRLETIGAVTLTFITNIGQILAVVVIAILGVKYMLGSTEDKAEYKKSMLPYVIGAVLVFGACSIGKMVIGLGNTI